MDKSNGLLKTIIIIGNCQIFSLANWKSVCALLMINLVIANFVAIVKLKIENDNYIT